MGSTEQWVYQRDDGAVIFHSENDGARALRRGLEKFDVVITWGNFEAELRQYPQLFAEAKRMLAAADEGASCGNTK
jgi:hypothetical protein